MGSRVQSTVGCFPELCFLQFSVAKVLVRLRTHFINNFVFPTWALAAGFNNNNNNNNNNNIIVLVSIYKRCTQHLKMTSHFISLVEDYFFVS